MMKGTDVFLILYASLFFTTVTVLSLLQVDKLDIYVALLAIEFFVASELTSPGGSDASRRKTVIGLILLAAFAWIVFERAIQILG